MREPIVSKAAEARDGQVERVGPPASACQEVDEARHARNGEARDAALARGRFGGDRGAKHKAEGRHAPLFEPKEVPGVARLAGLHSANAEVEGNDVPAHGSGRAPVLPGVGRVRP